jgi:hypothetical protein
VISLGQGVSNIRLLDVLSEGASALTIGLGVGTVHLAAELAPVAVGGKVGVGGPQGVLRTAGAYASLQLRQAMCFTRKRPTLDFFAVVARKFILADAACRKLFAWRVVLPRGRETDACVLRDLGDKFGLRVATNNGYCLHFRYFLERREVAVS